VKKWGRELSPSDGQTVVNEWHEEWGSENDGDKKWSKKVGMKENEGEWEEQWSEIRDRDAKIVEKECTKWGKRLGVEEWHEKWGEVFSMIKTEKWCDKWQLDAKTGQKKGESWGHEYADKTCQAVKHHWYERWESDEDPFSKGKVLEKRD